MNLPDISKLPPELLSKFMPKPKVDTVISFDLGINFTEGQRRQILKVAILKALELIPDLT